MPGGLALCEYKEPNAPQTTPYQRKTKLNKQTMKTLNCSKRKYVAAWIENGTAQNYKFSLKTILDTENDYEYAYAIQENIDQVLDLKPGEFLQMEFNRDSKSPGYISRIE